MKKWVLIIMVLILSTPVLLRADDTEIYGTVTSTSLEPNVLIIFDSSGSMTTEEVATKHLGVDLGTDSFWKDAVGRAVANVDEFVKLADSL